MSCHIFLIIDFFFFSTIPGGFTCADTLRQNGFRGRILLFTREGTLPYDR
ncbi:unnamed protein product, partial [Rotaria sp. Silwood1]